MPNSLSTLKVTATKAFQRDAKRLSPKQLFSVEMTEVMYLLQRNQPLPRKYLDHALRGEMEGFRDCHIFNDLVLIYQLVDNAELKLIRLGSHSEIF
ncbi:addiction module toxin RelE [Rodentibacter ratti]|uniref:Addiction module toxin RelE n=1 Tax=Rodentibacter ratti TaxID=1906745 RepID=A0A1V3L3E0_9PAST|nr:type II toxin-antitoxin system mRNA interferase toxin, RelE/StbE family [Rodentibacter ratti]OOF84341.1 addiction module toxin RelE [Rodentibacter ratti]OOF88647.1 addiction module toxin RelE [Rodentibacter ratti]